MRISHCLEDNNVIMTAVYIAACIFLGFMTYLFTSDPANPYACGLWIISIISYGIVGYFYWR